MYTNKHIWNISYPIFLSLLAQNVINVTDTAFLGRVGEVELGASAMGGLVLYLRLYDCIRVQYRLSDRDRSSERRAEFPGHRPCGDSGHSVSLGISGGTVSGFADVGRQSDAADDFVGRDMERDDGVSRLAAVRILLFVRECHVPRFVCRYNENEGLNA